MTSSRQGEAKQQDSSTRTMHRRIAMGIYPIETKRCTIRIVPFFLVYEQQFPKNFHSYLQDLSNQYIEESIEQLELPNYYNDCNCVNRIIKFRIKLRLQNSLPHGRFELVDLTIDAKMNSPVKKYECHNLKE